MRILILGNTGFVGRRIERHALEHGHVVVGVSRTATSTGTASFEQHRAERTQTDRILDLIRSRHIETVIDAAAFTLEDSEPLISAIDGAVARYVMLSSGDIYLNYGIINRRDEGVPIETWLAEESPLRESRFPYRAAEPRSPEDPLRWMDNYDKIPIEERVRGMARTQWTILRLPMVYGRGDRSIRFSWIIAPIQAGAERLPIPRMWARWRTTYGYVDNVAAGVVLAATQESAARETFNLGEAEPATHMEWARRFAVSLKWTGALEESDDPNLPMALLTGRMDLAVPLMMSTTRIRSALGFRETVSLEDAIDRTRRG